jgi:hypothetical protein
MSLLSVSLLLAAGQAMAGMYTDDVSAQRKMFDNFKVEHAKTYESAAEEAVHFDNFVTNLKEADALNAEASARGESTVFGVTSLMDLNMTAYGSPNSAFAPRASSESELEAGHRKLPGCDSSTTATSKDWTGTLTTAVNNMGWCSGGHWAFSVAQQMESDAKREFGSNYVLSAQQLLHCVTNNNGCNAVGSSQNSVADYAFSYAQNQGLYLSSNYPFTSSSGQTGGPCYATQGNNEKVRVDATHATLTGQEGCMAHYVQNTGPLAVCLTTGAGILLYTGGIMAGSSCTWGGSYTVCMQAVGVNLAGSTPYWKLRGSGGTGWGEGGYMRLAYGSNACNVNQNPVYTSVLVEGDF